MSNQKIPMGGYMICVWPNTHEWRAYRIKSNLGGETGSVRVDQEYDPKIEQWTSSSAVVRTSQCLTHIYDPVEETFEPPSDFVQLLQTLTEGLKTMRADQRAARDRYIVHLNLVLPAPRDR